VTKKKFLMFLLIFGVIYLGYHLLYRTESAQSEKYEITSTPTLFIHGYKGNYSSFHHLLERFEHEYHWGKRALVCKVTKNGRVLITETGPLKTDQNLFIQVLFEDNRASFKDTATWLSKVMEILKDRYGIEKVNIVGHSMGGIISVKYLQDYGEKNQYPKVEKLITMGSPFAGIHDADYFKTNNGAAAIDLKPESKALKALHTNQRKFPHNVQVWTIASIGDQLVNVDSALSIKKSIRTQSYREEILYEPQITHSRLHESKKVDQLIGRCLWGY